MKLTKLFVGAFALTAMLVACDSDSASAKDTEIEELSSSSAVEIASSSSTIRNDSSSSSAMETSSSSAIESSSSSAIEIASSSSTIRNDNSSSSSEATQSSSSTATTTLCSELPEGVCNYGTLTDSRDGQTYKTVTIGDQTWMAENLNYETENSYCYDDDPSNCSKYGRLYTWAAAMDSVGTWSINGKGCGYTNTCSPTYPVRGVCPSGWHLPSITEFETLFTTVRVKSTAGKALKSTSGWNEYEGESGNGTDAFGFSALPAGRRHGSGDYYYEGLYAIFWSSTEYNSNVAYSMILYYYEVIAHLNYDNKYFGFSVRCLKD